MPKEEKKKWKELQGMRAICERDKSVSHSEYNRNQWTGGGKAFIALPNQKFAMVFSFGKGHQEYVHS